MTILFWMWLKVSYYLVIRWLLLKLVKSLSNPSLEEDNYRLDIMCLFVCWPLGLLRPLFVFLFQDPELRKMPAKRSDGRDYLVSWSLAIVTGVNARSCVVAPEWRHLCGGMVSMGTPTWSLVNLDSASLEGLFYNLIVGQKSSWDKMSNLSGTVSF